MTQHRSHQWPALRSHSWFGLLAPAGTPPEVVRRIEQETAKAMSTAGVTEKLLAQGAITGAKVD